MTMPTRSQRHKMVRDGYTSGTEPTGKEPVVAPGAPSNPTPRVRARVIQGENATVIVVPKPTQ